MEGPGNLSERADVSPLSSDTVPKVTNREDKGDTSCSDPGIRKMDSEQMEQTVTSDQNNNNQSVADDKCSVADDIRRSEGRSLRTRFRRRLVPEKVRHKRQTLQDMARPLKNWLYQHRDNPYPSKSEKVALAAGSHMTLIQVSNWFANARRRLKNTVRAPNLSWGKRIKLYNTCVVGNAELFSVSSEDSIWDSEDEGGQNPTFPTDQSEVISDVQSIAMDTIVPSRAASPECPQWPLQECRLPVVEDSSSMHIKYKHTILQRYLNDHYHSGTLEEQDLPRTRDRRQSGSLGSRDYEEMSTSSASSPFNDIQHNVFEDFPDDSEAQNKRRRMAEDESVEKELYWKTIDAAVALTTLSRANHQRI